MPGLTVTAEEALELLIHRISVVMAVEEARVDAASRLDEDLHADSLDLVEIVDGVEADLRARGIAMALPDTTLATLRTVGDAADQIAEHAALSAPHGAAAHTSLPVRGRERD